MKRSSAVALGALMVAACGMGTWGLVEAQDDDQEEEHSQICADEQTGMRVEDEQCDENGHSGAHWYYGSSRHSAPAVGQPVDRSHFSTTKPTFGKVSTVSRGGFGGMLPAAAHSTLINDVRCAGNGYF